jgi:hypothetical protein
MTCFSNEYLLSVFYVVGELRTSEHVAQYKAVSVIDLDVDRAIVVMGIKRVVPSAIDAIEVYIVDCPSAGVPYGKWHG